MPKIVDHDQRRRDLIDATWRIIGRGGFEAATLQGIAREAGFANGVVRHYFHSKRDLLAGAFRQSYQNTAQRADAAIGDGTGLEAARKLCLELLPLDAERVLEAKVTVAFWDYAASDPELTAIQRDATRRWAKLLNKYFDDARSMGEMRADIPTRPIVDQLIWMAYGLQVMPVLMPTMVTVKRQLAALDHILDSVRAV
jgi:AcrR family transcriptional regulator